MKQEVDNFNFLGRATSGFLISEKAKE